MYASGMGQLMVGITLIVMALTKQDHKTLHNSVTEAIVLRAEQ